MFGKTDDGFQTDPAGHIGDRLAMVAGGKRDHTFFSLFVGEAQDLVSGAPDLK